MADVQYTATLEESLSILDDLAKNGFRLIPDPGGFAEPSAPSYDHVTDEVRRILSQRRSVYLAHPSAKYPPGFFQLKTGPMAGMYAISPFDGGPLLQMFVAAEGNYDGRLTLIGGNLGHQSYFKNPESGAREAVPAEFRAAYRSAIKIMRKHLVRHDVGGKIWIGPEALRLFKEGKVLLQHADKIKAAGTS
jgi:hypothetical protein